MKSTAETWWVYMLLCRGGRYYVGISNDVISRYRAHQRGKGAMFTRLNPPEQLVAAAPIGTKIEAMRVEYALKRGSRLERIAWAKSLQTANHLPTFGTATDRRSKRN